MTLSVTPPDKCHCEAHFAEAISYFAEIFCKKGDCRA
jgi:hypothetical protein